MWFSIPFALATSLGLSVVALDLPLTVDEGNLGLVPPAAALAILGNGGAILVVCSVLNQATQPQPAVQKLDSAYGSDSSPIHLRTSMQQAAQNVSFWSLRVKCAP